MGIHLPHDVLDVSIFPEVNILQATKQILNTSRYVSSQVSQFAKFPQSTRRQRGHIHQYHLLYMAELTPTAPYSHHACNREADVAKVGAAHQRGSHF